MAIRIITDSTVDVGNQYSDRFIVVPLTVTFGETEFIDGVTLDKTEFYQKLEKVTMAKGITSIYKNVESRESPCGVGGYRPFFAFWE